MEKFADLLGKTLAGVENLKNEKIVFTLENGEKYMLYHSQDCCESVTVEDISGDLKDLVGSPITLAEETSNRDDPAPDGQGYEGSWTWTYYKLATVNGYVTIRWYGESNGYYSESVDFGKA